MSNSTICYETPTNAIRVFCGFPSSQQSETQFFAQLGQTFMPGTPYMLQPLGLAAYLPGVISDPAPGLPHEFALICYPSQDVWDAGMNHSLRGRVYNQTHGGVYDMAQSGAAFPIFADNLPPLAADPFFLFSANVDWQTGRTCVIIGPKKTAEQSGDQFRISFRAALLANREALRSAGADQVIAMARDLFGIIWIHGSDPERLVTADWLQDILASPTVLQNERTICTNEPPVQSLSGDRAINFIFIREDRYFLK